MYAININNRVVMPPYIRELLNDDVWLAGGALRSYINNEYVEDYDLFFSNRDVDGPAKVEQSLLARGFKVTFKCPEGKLTSLKDGRHKIQLIIHKYYNSMNDMINSFDFTVTMVATNGKIILADKRTFKDLRSRRLNINKLEYPSATLKRLYKYINRGYNPSLVYNQIVRHIKYLEEAVDEDLVYLD